MKEITEELAKVLIPEPVKDEHEEPDDHAARAKSASEARNALVGELMMAAGASPAEDPVLARLGELAAQKREIQRQIRLITAYAREFVRPEPYRLRALAEAAGMSISTIRTIYDTEDKIAVATRIGRKDVKNTVRPVVGEQWRRLPARHTPGDATPPVTPSP
ncbi:hypothetical protein [Nonomuraea diastatica]|uniref:Uncharacterized protein n=1 Tax=Nonomuraea diastatica TaxID=1848329 RepID=A0A4R4WNM7_9ACTN|nr:hypothetical protein [Nonomuraea diastatica]TDD17615.1 hypothetical protein E1294_27035 [Nonomuraea diastatica]